MAKRKITIYNHPGDPALALQRKAQELSNEEILLLFESYKTWHNKLFGENETQKLTKGRKIVVWKPVQH
jgi:hypothetical protein